MVNYIKYLCSDLMSFFRPDQVKITFVSRRERKNFNSSIPHGCVVHSLVHSHWSRNVEAWLSLVESFIVLKYFHAIKDQLKACEIPPVDFFVPFAGSLLHEDRWLPCTERSYKGRLQFRERI